MTSLILALVWLLQGSSKIVLHGIEFSLPSGVELQTAPSEDCVWMTNFGPKFLPGGFLPTHGVSLSIIIDPNKGIGPARLRSYFNQQGAITQLFDIEGHAAQEVMFADNNASADEIVHMLYVDGGDVSYVVTVIRNYTDDPMTAESAFGQIKKSIHFREIKTAP